jgi:hypothetical protein
MILDAPEKKSVAPQFRRAVGRLLKKWLDDQPRLSF